MFSRFFLSVFFILCSCSLHAQRSVFSKDTVSFNYYHLDDNDKIRSTFILADEKNLDTILDRTIFRDNKGRIYWNTGKHAYGKDGLALELWNLGFHEKDETVREVAEKIPKEMKPYLPIFQAFQEQNMIYYRTVGSNPKYLFKISLSKKDTLEQLPFFMNDGFSALHLNHLKLTYNDDTTINIKGQNIACYKFKSQVNRFADDLQTFSLNYHELLLEKSSLLPVLMIERRCYRAYFKKTSADDQFSGYGINYLTEVIQIK